MPMLMLPNGTRYSLHTGVPDMVRERIASRFGLAGMLGLGDARFTGPARGPSVVLPLVRGHDGWFYKTDGQRAQNRWPGMGWLGAGPVGTCGTGPGQIDCSKNTPNAYQIAQGIIGFNPDGSAIWSSPAAQQAYTCSSPAGMYDPSCTAAQLAAPQPTATSVTQSPLLNMPGGATCDSISCDPSTCVCTACGGGTHMMPGCTPGGPGLNLNQFQASQQTGQPNQSVPPQNPLTPLPTGTGASGGNPILAGSVQPQQVVTTSSNTGLLLAAAAVAALFIFGGK